LQAATAIAALASPALLAGVALAPPLFDDSFGFISAAEATSMLADSTLSATAASGARGAREVASFVGGGSGGGDEKEGEEVVLSAYPHLSVARSSSFRVRRVVQAKVMILK